MGVVAKDASQGLIASDVGKEYNACMQYTLRNIPQTLDRALRRRALEEGTSLNEAAIQAMIRGMGLAGEPQKVRDLSAIAGSWVEDPEFDRALAEQDVVDEDLWK